MTTETHENAIELIGDLDDLVDTVRELESVKSQVDELTDEETIRVALLHYINTHEVRHVE